MRAKKLNDEDFPSPQSGAGGKPADPAVQLKTKARRRLIGAAVLALTAVIVVPLVLDTKPRPWADDVNIQIPSKDSKFEPQIKATTPEGKAAEKAAEKAAAAKPAEAPQKTPPAAEPPPEAVVATNTPPPPAVAPKAAPPVVEKTPAKTAEAPPKAVEKKAERPPEKAAEKSAEKPAEKPKTASGKIIVQAGAFATEEKIKSVEQAVRQAGYSPYLEELSTSKGVVTRVRFTVNSAEAADRAVAKLTLEGLSAKVVAQ